MQNANIKFKELRTKLGYTQAEIARQLNMQQQAWARFENGGVPDPRSSTIILICKTFKISADWLLGIDG